MQLRIHWIVFKRSQKWQLFNVNKIESESVVVNFRLHTSTICKTQHMILLYIANKTHYLVHKHAESERVEGIHMASISLYTSHKIGGNITVVMHYAYWINHFARKVNCGRASERAKESIKHLILMWPITANIMWQNHAIVSRTMNQQIGFKIYLYTLHIIHKCNEKGQFSVSLNR